MGITVEGGGWPAWWGHHARCAPHAVNELLTPPTEEPLTVVQGKLRAGLDWADGDPRDDLMKGFIAAARQKVETDAGLALLTQTRRVVYDVITGPVVQLPARPLQAVSAITATDPYGAVTVIDPAAYQVDLLGGRIYFTPLAPVAVYVRPFRGWSIDVVAGYADVAALSAAEPQLLQAVGLLVAHYATAGRDLAVVGTITSEVPQGYDDLIAPYRPVTVA